MLIIKGTVASEGIAFGSIHYLKNEKEEPIKRTRIEHVENEIQRYREASKQAEKELDELYQKTVKEVGETNAMIFEIHKMMLCDDDYIDSIQNIITQQKVNAEYAVVTTGDNFAAMFSAMDDAYMKERASDVKDISSRLVSILKGNQKAKPLPDRPTILVSQDLTPSETVQLDKSKIQAFITKKGSTNSHTAILSRMMNIPAIVSVGDALQEDLDGRPAIVDGQTGTIYVEPDEKTLIHFKQLANQIDAQKQMLEQLKGQENITLDGHKIEIFANIGAIADVAEVLKNDAGGIGLFRSEFLYLEKETYPSEQEQFQAYKLVAENMAGKKVIIRTLDIGADKQIDYFNLEKEENPAMGYRAIRICLDRVGLFKTQLRALYRASAFGNIAILFPMITSTNEIKQIYSIIKEVKQSLDEDGISYSPNVELGIMIETPASVMISDQLAPMVDFFSIGTNDLTQYTLAIDRQNEKLDSYYQPYHLGLLRMIQLTADNAHRAGIWVGICGELAGDLNMTETFLAIGIDELSVAPSKILALREKIRNTNVKQIEDPILKKLRY